MSVVSLLQYAMAVYALDMDAGFELGAGVFPTGGHDARAVAGLEHLCTGTVEGVYLHRTGIGDESQRVVAGNRRTAVGGDEIGIATVVAAQCIYFFYVYFGYGSGSLGFGCRAVGLLLAYAQYATQQRALSEASAGLRSAFTRNSPSIISSLPS